MSAVLISVKPEECLRIAEGKQTVLVQKTFPKESSTPFKVYVYCTMGNVPQYIYNENLEKESIYTNHPDIINGRVICEFMCDEITDIHYHEEAGGYGVAMSHPLCDFFAESTCLKYKELHDYLKGNTGYGWHTSDLVVYDKPKDLSEFKVWVENKVWSYPKKIEKPPRSWRYVEELKEMQHA